MGSRGCRWLWGRFLCVRALVWSRVWGSCFLSGVLAWCWGAGFRCPVQTLVSFFFGSSAGACVSSLWSSLIFRIRSSTFAECEIRAAFRRSASMKTCLFIASWRLHDDAERASNSHWTVSRGWFAPSLRYAAAASSFSSSILPAFFPAIFAICTDRRVERRSS